MGTTTLISSLGTRPLVETTPRPDDRFHTVVEGGRLGLFAPRDQGRIGLWLCIRNNNDFFFPLDIKPGRAPQIPFVEHAQMRLLS